MIPWTQNLIFFKILSYKTLRVFSGFEQLSSPVMAGQSLPWEVKLYILWNVLNFVKNCVFEP